MLTLYSYNYVNIHTYYYLGLKIFNVENRYLSRK